MKNYWIQLRRNKDTKFYFELIGLFPKAEFTLCKSAQNVSGLGLKTTDPRAVAWVRSTIGSPQQRTTHDGFMSILRSGHLVEKWAFYSVQFTHKFYTSSGTEPDFAEIYFTCQNAPVVKSAYFKFN